MIKSLLFLNAGAVEYATGTRDLKKLGGLNHKMPVTGITQFIGAMSVSGVPPFNGFWSKLIIIIAAVQAGRLGYAFCAVVASLLTLGALMKVVRYGFRGPLKAELAHIKEVPILHASSYGSFGVRLCVRRVPAYSRNQGVVLRSGRECDSSRKELHAFSFAAFCLIFSFPRKRI